MLRTAGRQPPEPQQVEGQAPARAAKEVVETKAVMEKEKVEERHNLKVIAQAAGSGAIRLQTVGQRPRAKAKVRARRASTRWKKNG